MNLGAKLLLNWLAVGVGVLLSIVLYRIQLNALGLRTLGTWLAISSLGGYLALLELGLGAAVNRYTATLSALRDRARQERLLSTALALYLGLAALVLTAGLIGSRLLAPLLRVPRDLLPDGQLAMLLLSLNIAASFVLGVWRGMVFGGGRTDLIALVTISRHLLYAVLIVALLRRGGGFRALAAAGLCADVSTGLLLVWLARRTTPASVRPAVPSPAVARELLRYCSSVLLICVGQHLLRGGALPIIQRWIGPEAVSTYAPADRLAMLFFTLVGQMGMVMVPPVAAACAADRDLVRPALIRAGRLGIALGLPPLLMLLLLAEELLVAWLGPAMAPAALLLHLLGVALLAQLISFGTDIGAYAVGGRRSYSLAKLVSGIACPGAVYIGIRLGSTPGAALGCSLAIALCDGLLTPAAVCRALRLRVADYYGGLLARGRWLVLLVIACALLLGPWRPQGLAGAVGAGAVGVCLGWLITCFLYLREEDRSLLRSRLHPAPRVMAVVRETA